jgi:hypothetical protein
MYFSINGIDRIPDSHRMLPSLFTPNPFVYAVSEICHRDYEKMSTVLLVSCMENSCKHTNKVFKR